MSTDNSDEARTDELVNVAYLQGVADADERRREELAAKDAEIARLSCELISAVEGNPFHRVQQMTLEEIEKEIGGTFEDRFGGWDFYSYVGERFRFPPGYPDKQLQAAQLCLLCKWFMEAQENG